MKEQIKLSIIDTLSYFDIFNYPLTLDQIYLFLHYNLTSRKLIKECIEEIPIIEKKYGYYFFSGRQSCAIKRKINRAENKRKTLLAANYFRFLGMVPGVKLVALTGSVAMSNASENDDIDVFIITRKNMLWTSRLVLIILTKLFGIKREYKSKSNKDKLCLNMFLDEYDMELPEKNLYTAHEIIQMQTYYDEHRVLENFINKNLWIRDYFPNLIVRKKTRKRNKKPLWPLFFKERILAAVNFSAFILQYIYMSRKITKENVSPTKAFFHPNNNKFILAEYKKRKAMYTRIFVLLEKLDKIELDSVLTKKAELIN